MEGKPRKLGFAALLALVLFCVNRGCSAVNASPSWVTGAAWFAGAAALLVVIIWLWDHTASHHWIVRTVCSVVAIAVIAAASYGPIKKQYNIEHADTQVKANKDTTRDKGKAPETSNATANVPKENAGKKVAKLRATAEAAAVPGTKSTSTKRSPPESPVQPAPQVQINSAPNGIAIGGGTVTNPTVNNFVPPQRSLNEEQKRKLQNELKGVPVYDFILRFAPNLESQIFAEQIGSLLIEAGWKRLRTPFRYTIHDVSGPVILVRSLQSAPQGAIALQELLKAIGIDASGVPTDTVVEGTFELYVGSNQ